MDEKIGAIVTPQKDTQGFLIGFQITFDQSTLDTLESDPFLQAKVEEFLTTAAASVSEFIDEELMMEWL